MGVTPRTLQSFQKMTVDILRHSLKQYKTYIHEDIIQPPPMLKIWQGHVRVIFITKSRVRRATANGKGTAAALFPTLGSSNSNAPAPQRLTDV
jgi:hypothetical protein